jgi:Fe-S oxidoreductase
MKSLYMPDETPFYEVSDAIAEAGGADMLKCYQCGTCTSVCPWRLTATMETRRMMHLAQLGLAGYEDETLWRCVTCYRCAEQCPRGVGITDVVAAARSLMAEVGSVPRSVSAAVGSLRASRNPWQGDRAQRSAWAAKAGLSAFVAADAMMLLPCCTSIFDARAQKGALAFARLLRLAGVRAGLPASGGICCGDLAVRTGAKDLALEIGEEQREDFRAAGFPLAAVLSPHCLVTLTRSAGISSPVRHYTQVLSALLDEGKLKVSARIGAKVTYHDPCYLGRWSGIYEEPRSVLRAAAGENFVEMERSRAMAVCCGGGGGGAFSDVPPAERLGVLRVREALETGAGIIATACPLCMLMLDDGVLASNQEGRIRVVDIATLLLEAVEGGASGV